MPSKFTMFPRIKDFLFGFIAVILGLLIGALLLVASIFFIPLWDDFTHNR